MQGKTNSQQIKKGSSGFLLQPFGYMTSTNPLQSGSPDGSMISPMENSYRYPIFQMSAFSLLPQLLNTKENE